MTERPTAHSKLLPMLATDGRLAEAVTPLWGPIVSAFAAKLGLEAREQDALLGDCLEALRRFAERPEGAARRVPLQHWLVRWRQDLSMEELLLVLLQLDRALRQAGWQLGLSAPDWLALSELVSGFFSAMFEEAAAGWQGLLAQNHQLRDELAYFHRLAASLESGQELGEHLNLAVRETARLLHCEFCAILLPKDGERDVLSIRAAVAPRILSRALEGMTFPLAENGLIAQVFLTGAPASTYQPLEDLEITMRRRQTLESLGFSQLMAYPLQTHGRVLGVLCVANRLDDQPWQALEEAWLSTVAAQLSATIRLSQSFGKQETSELELARAIHLALAVQDAALAAHGAEVGRLARRVGAALGLGASRLELIEMAGWLHDLGLTAVPESLRHRPSPLWPVELAALRPHPTAAAEALAPIKALDPLLAIIRHHHERWDGQGYPDGLRGQAIPLEARILAVADAYCAMVTPRAYAPAFSPEAAVAEIKAQAGSQFDSVAVQALIEALKAEDSEAGVEGLMPLPIAPAAAPDAPASPAPAGTEALLAEAPRLIRLLGELVAAEEPEAFFERFWRALVANAGFDAGTLWRMGVSGGLTLAHAHQWQPAGAIAPADAALESYAAACRVPVAIADWSEDARFARPPMLGQLGMRSALALPLVAADRPVGALTIYRREPAPFTTEEQAVLELAAAMAAHGLQALDLAERSREELGRDPLTGLASHRGFMERLAAEIKRAERFKLPLSAVLLDLDGFSAYNEANGYGLGDEALKQAAELAVGHLRPADLASRFEGDALALLLPECGVPEAMTIGEQIRLAIAASLFPSRRAGGARLTVSVGVTSLAQGEGGAGELVAAMRQALAGAKAEGRNRLLFHARSHEKVNG